MCPVCSEPMVVLEMGGVEIDRCVACGGTWLDAGELAEIAPPGPLREAIVRGEGARHGKRRCVRCRTKLRVVAVHEVEIDRCPRGHGLWLDAGEMERLIRSDLEPARFFGDLYASAGKKGG